MTITNTELAVRVDNLLTQFETLIAGQILLPVQNYQTDTADADPGAGNFRLNNSNLANVTEAYLDDQDTQGTSIEAFLATYDDSSSLTKGTLVFKSLDNAANFAAYTVTGNVVDASGYTKVTLTHVFSSGSWAADESFGQQFYRAGDPGAASALSAGTVTTLEPGEPVSVDFTGTAPNQVLNIGIPKGDTGEVGPPPNLVGGTVTTGNPGTAVQAVLLGESPNYVLNLTIPAGLTGDQGEDGFGFVYGDGPPDDQEDGRNGDTYLDESNATIYPRKINGAWPLGISLVGPIGPNGNDGADGNSIKLTAGVPLAADGVDGDLRVDRTTLDLYERVSGAYILTGTLKGEAGSGTGDVVGPTSSVSGNIAIFDSSTGQLIGDSGISPATITANLDARTGASAPKTADFTFIANGVCVPVDTSGNTIAGTLPENPAIGTHISFIDAGDFSANTFTIERNGQLIEGLDEDMEVTRAGAFAKLRFMGGSIGWKVFAV